MCYVSVLFSIPNLIIWKKYKKIYICYMREVRFYLFVAIPWNVGRILMSSRVLVCVFQHKSFMSLFVENWNCRFQFYENYKNDRAKCKRKRDSIVQKFRDTIFRWNEFYYCSFSRILGKHFSKEIILFVWKLYVVWKKKIF